MRPTKVMSVDRMTIIAKYETSLREIACSYNKWFNNKKEKKLGRNVGDRDGKN